MNKFECGAIVTGYVTGVEKYGIFVCIDEHHTGLIHISEITSSFVRNIYDYVKIGETIHAKIIGIDSDGRLKLSIKDIDYKGNKGKNNRIIETPKGFSTLSKCLDGWIKTKEKAISVKKVKK